MEGETEKPIIDIAPPEKPKTRRRLPMPTEAALINREAMSDEAIASAVKREDELVRQGLEAMGLTNAESAMALSLSAFQRGHFRSSAQMIGGGITKTFIGVMVEVEAINARLNMGDKLELPVEMMLREDRRGLLDVLAKFADRSNKSVLVQAQVMEIAARARKDAQSGGGSGGKPGFSPLKSANASGPQESE